MLHCESRAEPEPRSSSAHAVHWSAILAHGSPTSLPFNKPSRRQSPQHTLLCSLPELVARCNLTCATSLLLWHNSRSQDGTTCGPCRARVYRCAARASCRGRHSVQRSTSVSAWSTPTFLQASGVCTRSPHPRRASTGRTSPLRRFA
jgi:hypothetical protein